MSNRPSSSGSTTFIARSAGDEAARRVAPSLARVPASTTCSTGTPAHRARVGRLAQRGERGRVEDDLAGRRAAISARKLQRRSRILEACDTSTASGAEASRVERRHQRVDRRRVGGQQHGAIEHDRATAGAARVRRSAATATRCSPCEPARRRHRAKRSAAEQRLRRDSASAHGRQILGAAFAEIARRAASQLVGGSGRERGEPRIGAVIAGQRPRAGCRARARRRQIARRRSASNRGRRAAHDHDPGAAPTTLST